MNFRTPCAKICILYNMLGFFSTRTRILKKLINNELQLCCTSNIHSTSHTQKPNLVRSQPFIVNNFSTCHCFFSQKIENVDNFNSKKMIVTKDGTVKKKKKVTGVKVYILNEKGISSSMFYHEAEKFAEHQGLELKKVEDINGIAAYKLATFSEVLDADTNLIKSDNKNNEKLKKIVISGEINPHDFGIKINQIKKFLNKGMKVFIRLGDKNSDATKLSAYYEDLEKALSEHSIGKVVSKAGYHINVAPKQKSSDSDGKDKKS